ncbi:spore germination protein GerPE [Heyndrickxia acidiproducens]|uniref:spore germination protein GerPE n=1 Tax=Heyndrickxia acidiproducens TaxID=1121084 RepID=UPI00036D8FA2|nr:spore germination protein GerPE [Heyndrickxia acidiproducens]
MARNSMVDQLLVKNVIFASNVIVGDSCKINMSARVLAIQRQKELYFGFEAPFEAFPIFSQVIPVPPITEEIQIQRYHADPAIKVGTVNIIGLSTSAVVQIGSTQDISLESRIHHVRQLDPFLRDSRGDMAPAAAPKDG